MATSYTNEHSAEFYLVPALKKILDSEFRFVAPLFPWLSREFGKVSKKLHSQDKFHILVMFPRRPKVTGHKDGEVFVTLNRELGTYMSVGNDYGIPVIAGCPNASDFWELASGDKFTWIDLADTSLNQYINPINSTKNASSWLTEEAIINMVKTSNTFDLFTFEQFLRKVRELQPERMYGGQYKPVYFLIKTY